MARGDGIVTGVAISSCHANSYPVKSHWTHIIDSGGLNVYVRTYSILNPIFTPKMLISSESFSASQETGCDSVFKKIQQKSSSTLAVWFLFRFHTFNVWFFHPVWWVFAPNWWRLNNAPSAIRKAHFSGFAFHSLLKFYFARWMRNATQLIEYARQRWLRKKENIRSCIYGWRFWVEESRRNMIVIYFHLLRMLFLVYNFLHILYNVLHAVRMNVRNTV